jgi:hypothetical protein
MPFVMSKDRLLGTEALLQQGTKALANDENIVSTERLRTVFVWKTSLSL